MTQLYDDAVAQLSMCAYDIVKSMGTLATAVTLKKLSDKDFKSFHFPRQC